MRGTNKNRMISNYVWWCYHPCPHPDFLFDLKWSMGKSTWAVWKRLDAYLGKTVSRLNLLEFIIIFRLFYSNQWWNHKKILSTLLFWSPSGWMYPPSAGPGCERDVENQMRKWWRNEFTCSQVSTSEGFVPPRSSEGNNHQKGNHNFIQKQCDVFFGRTNDLIDVNCCILGNHIKPNSMCFL